MALSLHPAGAASSILSHSGGIVKNECVPALKKPDTGRKIRLLVMKITIVYDNKAVRPGLSADHGFSCLVETEGAPAILFDTGARGPILRHNMAVLGVEPGSIGTVVISHRHSDHIGGLSDVIEMTEDVEVFLPESFMTGIAARRVTRVRGRLEISPGVYSTGELSGIEQSLVLATGKGPVVLVGCAHSGLDNILRAASRFGEVWGVIGGFHGFRDFHLLDPLSLICPCHCTVYRDDIRRLCADRYRKCGVGTVIEL
jgi:7,8-dihydropterin-6-yl-methyl-4-(beta-D-ribofuranosyl)aminobenzene 5'-phosphate synthase